jgi:hypothetical protein
VSGRQAHSSRSSGGDRRVSAMLAHTRERDELEALRAVFPDVRVVRV